MISSNFISLIEAAYLKASGKELLIESSKSLSGGDINDAFRLETNRGSFFLKANSGDRYQGMFASEAQGLELLFSAKAFRVPRVICCEKDFLLLEWIEGGNPTKDFWKSFGRNLAKLHLTSHERFGLDHDNYIGSLAQENTYCDSWQEFFISNRLESQLRIARNSGQIGVHFSARFNRLFGALEDFFPLEPPSLLHGDLWSGNYMIDGDGKSVIMDPSVYFGHREMDLGMTRLFGGFDPQVYQSYQEVFPLEKDWEKRIDVANLYPLLVHLNLFGNSYLPSIERILQRFS